MGLVGVFRGFRFVRVLGLQGVQGSPFSVRA